MGSEHRNYGQKKCIFFLGFIRLVYTSWAMKKHRYITMLLVFHKKKPFHLSFLLPLTVFDHAFKKCVSTPNTLKSIMGETVWSRITGDATILHKLLH